MALDKDYEYRIIDDRAVGKDVPFSVGLARPIETQLIKEKIEFAAVFMNCKTLFRAYHGSYRSEDRPATKALIDGFVEELTNIKAFVEQLGYDVTVYIPLYSKPKSKFPDAKPKLAENPNQRIYADQENKACQLAHDEKQIDVVTDYTIGSHKGRTAILTHMPVDLLSQYNFGELVLLESQTGTLKERHEWNTKLGAPENVRPKLPFNILTLQVFGDKAKLFSSIKELKQKKALLQLAADKRWTPYTSLTRIRKDLNELEKDTADRFIRMLSVKLK